MTSSRRPLSATLMAATVGVFGGISGLPFIAAALFRAQPLSFMLLAIGLIWLLRLGATAGERDLPRVRLAWKSTAWLLLAAGVAAPVGDPSGPVVWLGFVAVSALVAALVDRIGERVVGARA